MFYLAVDVKADESCFEVFVNVLFLKYYSSHLAVEYYLADP